MNPTIKLRIGGREYNYTAAQLADEFGRTGARELVASEINDVAELVKEAELNVKKLRSRLYQAKRTRTEIEKLYR